MENTAFKISNSARIKLLSEDVINQISAGEVVERPASVVRELLDNSLDAGATDISVYLEEGGRRVIRVVDNGSGMAREDAILAFENHATSKITQANDLQRVTTYGFRGEALASIASISKIELKTRAIASTVGTLVQIEGGKIIKVDSASCNEGTDLCIRALFFNTPARRKFLKSQETEEAKVRQWIIQSAIPNFTVRYRLFTNGKEILNLPKVASLIERSRAFIKGSFSEFSHKQRDILISGIVGHPGSASTLSSSLVIVVNGRVVKDNIILRAVREGFSSTLKSYESPVGLISIELPYSQVDVNVHPQKSEVRFLSSGEIFVAVRDGVAQAVKGFISPIYVKEKEETYQSNLSISSTSNISHSQEAINFVSKNLKASPIRFEAVSSFDYKSKIEPAQIFQESTFKYSSLKYVGQIFDCFLLCEGDGQLCVVDMHAAHERVNYNRIREGFKTASVPEQRLLMPLVVAMPQDAVINIVENAEGLSRWGFEVERFGREEIAVRSAPSIMKISAIPDLLKEIGSLSLSNMTDGAISEKIDHIAARIACHTSIRSGKIMNKEEAYSLFSAMDETELSGVCPHGRPVVVEFSKAQVERWFGRDK